MYDIRDFNLRNDRTKVQRHKFKDHSRQLCWGGGGEASYKLLVVHMHSLYLCLGADHLIPGGGGGLWFFCEKKDCSANFGK